jgi:hypothetical protein
MLLLLCMIRLLAGLEQQCLQAVLVRHGGPGTEHPELSSTVAAICSFKCALYGHVQLFIIPCPTPLGPSWGPGALALVTESSTCPQRQLIYLVMPLTASTSKECNANQTLPDKVNKCRPEGVADASLLT